jgi:radical SAM modification target selenobiotic family peptide
MVNGAVFLLISMHKEAAMEIKELKKIVAGLSVAGLIGVGGLVGSSAHAGSSG